jgi:hypothetical protein
MPKQKTKKAFLFEKRNYLFLGPSISIIALGFILMSGGGSDNPEVFNPEIYSIRRIRVAPTLVLLGFGIAIYAILTQQKKGND